MFLTVVVVGVPENDFPRVPEELDSNVARPFSVVIN